MNLDANISNSGGAGGNQNTRRWAETNAPRFSDFMVNGNRVFVSQATCHWQLFYNANLSGRHRWWFTNAAADGDNGPDNTDWWVRSWRGTEDFWQALRTNGTPISVRVRFVYGTYTDEPVGQGLSVSPWRTVSVSGTLLAAS